MDLVAHSVGDVVDGARRAPSRTVVACVLALLIGMAGAVLVGRVLTGSPAAVRPASAQYLPSAVTRTEPPAPELSLRDQGGSLVTMASLRGQVALVTFMDPQCKEQCPIIGQELGSIEASLPATVKPVLVVVSVAANRTAADVSAFAAHTTWQPGWHWLLGNQAELASVWANYHIAVVPTATDVGHDSVVYVVDPKGRLVAGYSAPLPVGEVTSLITTQSTR